MKELVTYTGMILTASPMKEYDRRVELLTRQRGRISAFAQGARKANSALSACTLPFTFGEFSLYEGRSSYTLKGASIQKFFGDLAQDYEMACYASYFAELARHLTRENVEAGQELLLLYATLSALQKKKMPFALIRIVYEMRMMSLAGQGIEIFSCLRCRKTGSRSVYFSAGGIVCEACAAKDLELKRSYPFVLSPDALYALQYMLSVPLEKLYAFLVSAEVLAELSRFRDGYLRRYLPHRFKSLEMLDEA